MKKLELNSRKKSAVIIILCSVFLLILFILNFCLSKSGLSTNLLDRNHGPSLYHLLGTDWLGRDMFTRVIKGLFVSFQIGITAALTSSILAVFFGISAAVFGRKIDLVITGMIDLFLSIPHLVLLILISFVLGGGFKGIIIAVAVSHWPRLARIIRAEILQLKTSEFVLLSHKFGKSNFWIMKNHMLSHIAGQFFVGTVLMFPHAILHSAGLSFIGFGLTPNNPCIGILLSESMRHLATGYWWLAIFPGIALVLMVLSFDTIGRNFSRIFDPKTREE
jgi:peptide/nickel transport system permease protein